MSSGREVLAADQTWTNGASNFQWNDASLNWSGAAWTDGNNAIFGSTGAGAVTVSGTQTVGNMTFSAGGYSFSGGTLEFNGASNTIDTGSDDVTISSAISFLSGGGISKSGTGKLTINSNITYAGSGQTIGNTGNNSGIIEIAGGNIHLTDVRIRGFGLNSSINITGGTIVLDGTNATRGLVTGGGGAINISGGTVSSNSVLIGNGSAGSMTVSGTAAVTVTGSNVVQVGAGASAATAVLNLNGGTLTAYRISSSFSSGNSSGITTINLNGTTIKASGDNLNWISPFNDAGNNSTSSRINVLAGGAIFDSNGSNVRIFRNLTGSAGDGGITKLGAGTVYLTGNNTVQGNTTVNAGTLLVGNASGSATGSGNIAVKSGATFGGRGSVSGTVTAESGSTLVAGGVSTTDFSTVAIGVLTTGSQIWNGGAGIQLEFSTNGLTGTAGSQWDLYTINGGLNLSAVSSASPVVLSLYTMVDATTRGALSSWDGSVSTVWSGFLTTTAGITGFSADKFDFDTSGFGNALNGTFSVALNGNNLDLVYTAVPEPSTAALMLMAFSGGAILIRRRGKDMRSCQLGF